MCTCHVRIFPSPKVCGDQEAMHLLVSFPGLTGAYQNRMICSCCFYIYKCHPSKAATLVEVKHTSCLQSLFYEKRREETTDTIPANNQYRLHFPLSVIISNNSHDNLLQLTHIYAASSPQRDLIGGTGVCSDGVTSLFNEAIPWCCLPVSCCINSTYMYGLNKWHYMRDVDGVLLHILLYCVALAYGSILLRFEMFSILHFTHTVLNFYLHH